ncbi:MAG: hypothetical protein ACPHJ4_01335, partial [Porticoccaceae bacterium]
MFSRQSAYSLLSQLLLSSRSLFNNGSAAWALVVVAAALTGFSANLSASSALNSNSQLIDAAPPIATDNQLADQRAAYAQSLKLIRKRDWQKLHRQRSKLVDYPLYPYLIYAELIADLRYARRHEVSNYLRRYKGSVKAQHLRARWLDYLARRAYWQAYTEYFDPQTASVSRQCNYYLAQ